MVGSDRKTAQERFKERRSLRSMCEFGERVMFRIPRARNMGEPAERQGSQECGLAWSEDVRKLLLGPKKNYHHVVHSQQNANKRKMEGSCQSDVRHFLKAIRTTRAATDNASGSTSTTA